MTEIVSLAEIVKLSRSYEYKGPGDQVIQYSELAIETPKGKDINKVDIMTFARAFNLEEMLSGNKSNLNADEQGAKMLSSMNFGPEVMQAFVKLAATVTKTNMAFIENLEVKDYYKVLFCVGKHALLPLLTVLEDIS